jgi:hypothetical protein
MIVHSTSDVKSSDLLARGKDTDGESRPARRGTGVITTARAAAQARARDAPALNGDGWCRG